MRKFWWIPTMLVIVACGGSGLEFIYPNTKELTIEFRNTSGEAVDMFVLPEAPTSVAAGGTRTARQTRTWLSESQVETFQFTMIRPGPNSSTLNIPINGQESHGQNFHGFLVTWDGRDFRATTR